MKSGKERVGNIEGKKKCWLPAFALFPKNDCKSFCLRIVKTWHSVVTGQQLTFNHLILTFDDPEKTAVENIEVKGENSANQHFLLF